MLGSRSQSLGNYGLALQKLPYWPEYCNSDSGFPNCIEFSYGDRRDQDLVTSFTLLGLISRGRRKFYQLHAAHDESLARGPCNLVEVGSIISNFPIRSTDYCLTCPSLRRLRLSDILGSSIKHPVAPTPLPCTSETRCRSIVIAVHTPGQEQLAFLHVRKTFIYNHPTRLHHFSSVPFAPRPPDLVHDCRVDLLQLFDRIPAGP